MARDRPYSRDDAHGAGILSPKTGRERWVYAALPGERPQFFPLRAPDRSEVTEMASRVALRTAALMESGNEECSGGEDSGIASMAQASVLGRISEGPHAGQRVRTAGGDAAPFGDPESFETGRTRCANVSGFSVHAGVAIRSGRRDELERLCQYVARPPLAADRLEQLPDGRLSYRLKTPWRNGTTHVIFEPLEFLEKLAVLAPVPRKNLIRFNGVLAPAAKWRSSIVPQPPADAESSCSHSHLEPSGSKRRRRNYEWANMMKRVFELDVLECPHCHGRLRILAAIHPPENTQKILQCLGLPTRAPPVKPVVPDTEFDCN